MKVQPDRHPQRSFLSFLRGSPPFFPRVPLALPYWDGATYLAIFERLRRGEIVDGHELDKLRASLRETLGVAAVVLCGSGSLALEIALGALGVHRGDEVIIPAFCCSAVIPPLLAVGAVPVLVDVGAELNMTAATIEVALGARTKAIIVAHLFGNPAEIAAILDLAQSRAIHVIDDAAQALGAKIDGRSVGSFGDLGVVSFGSEKVCFGLGGGAVILPSHELAAKVAHFRLSDPSHLRTLGNLLSTLIWHRWRRWSQPLQRAFPFSSRGGPDTPPVPYRKEGMANLNAAVACSLMETLQANIDARCTRVRAYQELLGGDERLQLVAHRDGSACLTQVMRVLRRRRNCDLAARVIEGLGKAGYEVQGSYVPIHLLPGHDSCKWHRLPHAEKVWEDLIELPCEPGVKLNDVARIAAVIKELL